MKKGICILLTMIVGIGLISQYYRIVNKQASSNALSSVLSAGLKLSSFSLVPISIFEKMSFTRVDGEISPQSQASQDKFVHTLFYELQGKSDDGWYLEIGSGHPIITSNTFFLEKCCKWKGCSVDIDDQYRNLWSALRSNELVVADATQVDYVEILKSFPEVIDYLSLDVDCSYDVILRKVISSDHVFKVITIEHDFYRFGEQYRMAEREILFAAGYFLLCPDVSVYFNGMDCVFEDWWIKPEAFSPDLLSSLKALDLSGKSHEYLIEVVKTCSRRDEV